MELELYLHIPFCVRKCAYCDFLSFPGSAEQQRTYVEALKKEILRFPNKKDYQVSTVFWGGGTPSVLPGEWLSEIMELLYREFSFTKDPEISVECNPGTADMEKLHIYREMGVNRLSFGLQSADDKELQLLGRIHTWQEFLQTYQMARNAGIDNINVDLMSALPGQTVDSWKQTMKRVLALEPEHISAYSLIIEEETPFFERYAKDAEKRDAGDEPEFLPSEDDERAMYHLTEEYMQEAGLLRYEISNYARTGYECRHNSGYWTGVSYAGFGLGASSYLDGERITNTSSMTEYLSDKNQSCTHEILSEQAKIEEFMFLGLRMIKGISKKEFLRRFGKHMDEVYGDVLIRMMSQGLIQNLTEDRISLSRKGLDISNYVMAEFLL